MIYIVFTNIIINPHICFGVQHFIYFFKKLVQPMNKK